MNARRRKNLLAALLILAATTLLLACQESRSVAKEPAMATAERPLTHPDGPTRYALFAAG